MKTSVRIVGLAGLLLFAAAAFTPLPSLLARQLAVASHPGPADAIVVLGAGVNEDGMLGGASLRRALAGILLHRQGLAPLLVLLGPSFDGSPPEAKVREQLARDLGVDPGRILTLQDAWTTREEAQKSRVLLAARGVRRILLVTDSQHLVRAIPLFARQGFEVLPVVADEESDRPRSPEGRLKLARRVSQEIVARAYHRVAGYL
ncbi:MAG: YdcF family protein [Candidatus Methylomirabilales bacterium]